MKKYYNLLFPVWLLWLIPVTWVVILPFNFLIDYFVLVLSFKQLHLEKVFKTANRVIIKTWLLGFLSDFIGVVVLFVSTFNFFGYETELGHWWSDQIMMPVSYNPFANIFSFLWVLAAVVVSGICIYFFNYKFVFKKLNICMEDKKKVAINLAVFTAPYLFFLPMALFY